MAINDLTDPKTLAHLLKYDSAHGRFDAEISVEGNTLLINGKSIHISAIKGSGGAPMGIYEHRCGLECTGIFRDREGMGKHLQAGARKVLLSAPAKKGIPTFVLGVNDHLMTAEDDL